MKFKKLIGMMAIAGMAAPGIASATNGYFAEGYGIKTRGMGGAGIALPQDAMAAATNPAGMVMVGGRLDIGLTYFQPDRSVILGPNGVGANPTIGTGEYTSDNKYFLIPEVGYNHMLNKDMALGVVVYGNGGLNTKYNKPLFSQGGSASNASSDMLQLFVAPTWSMKINENNAIGVSLNLVYQQFSISGLEGFAGKSSDSVNLTGNGHDKSTGYGLKLGWTGKVAQNVTLGATYQTLTKMSKFDKYKGMLAEGGSLDIPSTYGLGIAVDVTPSMIIAADVVRINYGDVKALNNPGSNQALLGTDNGPGFGWNDQTVYKLGLSYKYSPGLTLRAGYNYAKAPFNSDQNYFNFVALATTESHLSLGATWVLADKSELSLMYMHAFDKGMYSSATDSTIRMKQDAIGIAYGLKM
ncbi:OmpP1/FadL family transporter [Sulfurirhabdus autotrophica]|uniref:Long-chain fatty acid transport protein n=1 Tax=Sulfurirhabdus autotrophica TaxID=1706046 RepID=A0A4R3XTM7_9PROT|nr:outer membrane protein transport protein [Sulfurirhabdus autotrophica]TCV82556.1 long-chain fatty acid transport protein [Sulfurirhabdus autotrophica]